MSVNNPEMILLVFCILIWTLFAIKCVKDLMDRYK